MGDCGVCCEKFNKSSHKPIECGWCEFLVCTSCTQRFLLDLPDTPQCMNCKHVWNREFLESKLTKTFINGALKKHREEVLYEIEKGLLPETQPHAEARAAVLNFEIERKKYNTELKTIRTTLFDNALKQPIITIERLENDKKLNIRAAILKVKIKYLDSMRQLTLGQNNGMRLIEATTEKRAFIKPCPAADCRGFLSTAWKCGLCDTRVCSKCHEIKKSEDDEDTTDDTEGEGSSTNPNSSKSKKPVHVCKPENLATVEALIKDSKPCPRCGSLIQKIEGCSQMFHTPLSGGCGAIFDWNTLRLHTDGAVHNPHWYEYQRHLNGGNIPRQVGDVPCGGAPTLNELLRNAGRCSDDKEITLKLSNIHRSYHHNQFVELPHYAVNVVNDNRDLRINYLLKVIDEKKFKRTIQQREKAREKKTHIHQVMTMYLGALADILNRIVQAPNLDALMECVTEIDGLVEYTNTSFENISKIYDCVKTFVSKVDYIFKTREIL